MSVENHPVLHDIAYIARNMSPQLYIEGITQLTKNVLLPPIKEVKNQWVEYADSREEEILTAISSTQGQHHQETSEGGIYYAVLDQALRIRNEFPQISRKYHSRTSFPNHFISLKREFSDNDLTFSIPIQISQHGLAVAAQHGYYVVGANERTYTVNHWAVVNSRGIRLYRTHLLPHIPTSSVDCYEMMNATQAYSPFINVTTGTDGSFELTEKIRTFRNIPFRYKYLNAVSLSPDTPDYCIYFAMKDFRPDFFSSHKLGETTESPQLYPEHTLQPTS